MFDENSIVDRILSGDDSAFDRIVDRYEHKVYQYALHFLGREESACLATEEVFYQMYSKLSERTDCLLSTWVFRITANVCADFQHYKRGAKGAAVFSDVVFRRQELSDKEQKEQYIDEAIQTLLLRLTRQQREVLLLCDLCGLSDEETGQILKLDERGVRSRLSRARKNLRELLLRQGILDPFNHPSGQRYHASKACHEYRELCSQYVDECISDADKTLLLDHIQECTSCAAYLNDLTVIGRSLSHMEEAEPPAALREKIISAARRQAEHVHLHRKRAFHLPVVMFVVAAAIFLALIGSGVLGGLFVNFTEAAQNGADNFGAGSAEGHVLAEEITVPETVTGSSYAFVIAASGNTDLPELSTAATLIAWDEDNAVEYYSVDNDINLVQKLTDGLESVGYEMESVGNNQIVIAANAAQGLFVIIHR